MNVWIPLDNSMDMLGKLMKSERRSLKGLKVMCLTVLLSIQSNGYQRIEVPMK